MSDRGTGKTTRIFEQAVKLLGELPPDYFVYITGAHSKWLVELEHRFKNAGLTDCKIVTINQIQNGRLRGCKGRLLIDDTKDLSLNDLDMVLAEQKILEHSNPIRTGCE